MPALIIHGGAGKMRSKPDRDERAKALTAIARRAWAALCRGESALQVAVDATVELEDCPLFNAGRGSSLQSDGGARLSAALMGSEHERFSGVINVEGITNPIQLAAHLQSEADRVLSGAGARARALELGLKEGDVRTEETIQTWRNRIEGKTGTVGVVALDARGRIAAATSTGGRGMERIGRVSDSATVAGNFATASAGVSCTGIGEDILNGSLASRLVTLVEAGIPLSKAATQLTDRMEKSGWKAGFIALDEHGSWAAPHTTDIMYWVAIDEAGEHRFTDPG